MNGLVLMDALKNPLRGKIFFLWMLLWFFYSFTDFYRKLYGHGIQSFLLCVLSISMSVPSVLTAGYSVALSLYGVLPITLTIVHFDGTPILSLHIMLATNRVETNVMIRYQISYVRCILWATFLAALLVHGT